MELAFPVSQNGMQSALLTQVLIAQNLANLSTPGYKAARAFGGTFRIPGTQIVETSPAMTPGPMRQTDRQLDLAIVGEGFFVVRAGGRRAFTRAGNFRVDEDGTIVTPAGFPLEGNIQVPPEATGIAVTTEGQIIATFEDGTGQALGQLEIARFPNPAGLLPAGDNVYVEGPDSGDAILLTPGDQGSGYIQQGFLEQSNVDEATEITNQIVNQRRFQVNLRTFQVMNEMLGKTVDLSG